MDTSMLHRDAWVEIQLDRIENNIKQIREYLPPSVKFMAAVKADAYGHGDLQVARIALKAGADALAVSILSEALYLRKNGIKAPILVLTPILPSDVNIAIEYDLSVTVFQLSWLKEMRLYKVGKKPLKIHLKMDTGLGRIGISKKEELEAMLPILNKEDIVVEGMYTHFATANREDSTYFNKQLKAFLDDIQWIKSKGLDISIFHCANSAATLKYKDSLLDMVRIGVAMFGIYPSEEIRRTAPVKLQTALSVHSKLLHVKKIKKGSFVGYDTAYQANSDEWIATVPIGYADGWFRCFQGFHVLVDGQKMPIIGKICMDQFMIRLPKKYPTGTPVVLIGKDGDNEITLEDLAKHINSVPQEIPSMITYRVPKVYYYNHEIVEVLTERSWSPSQYPLSKVNVNIK
ncbi:alanine racemase [Proteiniborus sp. MB09-C3]|uniref:alanine racemase n=1 Tax=Proteiniborus sp. MB09-C3 TaxID=3050072 RepID=UPI0025571757|nr:alanine racemase [Proteiniborus sp. MB09-C3]WIV12765.1 alanine racemase [Proteiniborus sp. MB09-C3]